MTIKSSNKKVNETASKSLLLGFVFDPTNVKAEIGKCQAVYNENKIGISTGLLPLKNYNEFLAKLKKAGSEIIAKEAQKQINAWAANK